MTGTNAGSEIAAYAAIHHRGIAKTQITGRNDSAIRQLAIALIGRCIEELRLPGVRIYRVSAATNAQMGE